MKAIMVMFDSLNRHMLPPYGCESIKAPNFERLARKTVAFDNCYVGSMPCMPARRELHTGRYNFLHRSWGPLEPFDDSMPEILKMKGIYTHLVSDHWHYWEDGGCTYHTKYSSWECSRGQEGDPWKGYLGDLEIPEHIDGKSGNWGRQDWVNRMYMQDEKNQPQAKTFRKGLEFIKTNYKEDNWFLQIETFDPHEPFFTNNKYKELYKHDYDGAVFDWPNYHRVKETEEQVQHCRYEYAALVSMCDTYLGKVLNAMDELDMWKDTMLIVNTDHGFLLGEHDWWGKCLQPFYNEIAHIPLFIWDPRCKIKDEHRNALVQTIDIAPTLLEYFNVDIPEDMQGKPLKETINNDKSVREAALFGIHGGHVNCTDGRYVYMRAPAKGNEFLINNYTLMPTHMKNPFSINELSDIQLSEPFDFTKGCRIMKIAGTNDFRPMIFPIEGLFEGGNLLYNIENDPLQQNETINSEVEKEMENHIIKLMKQNNAPIEQYERLGLNFNID